MIGWGRKVAWEGDSVGVSSSSAFVGDAGHTDGNEVILRGGDNELMGASASRGGKVHSSSTLKRKTGQVESSSCTHSASLLQCCMWLTSPMQWFLMWAMVATAVVLRGWVQDPCEYEDIFVLLINGDQDSSR